VSDPILVDTHVLLWWQADSDRLSAPVQRLLRSTAAVLVSPISCWEVAMLVAKGRVELDRPVLQWVRDLLASPQVDVAELTPEVAVQAGRLDDFRGDPADRFLYATALSLGVEFVTKDDRIRTYAERYNRIPVIW
jgi:PIN domain nuclease of toxin-antitoxin system